MAFWDLFGLLPFFDLELMCDDPEIKNYAVPCILGYFRHSLASCHILSSTEYDQNVKKWQFFLRLIMGQKDRENFAQNNMFFKIPTVVAYFST